MEVNMNNFNFDTRNYKPEELEFLRGNTILGPISVLKIQIEKGRCEKIRDLYHKAEGELLEVDYSSANELEYELRMRAWENSWAREWNKNPDGLGLAEFAQMIMEEKMREAQRH